MTEKGVYMKYTNYPPGVREWDFIGDEEDVEEQEDSDFEDYYYDLKKRWDNGRESKGSQYIVTEED